MPILPPASATASPRPIAPAIGLTRPVAREVLLVVGIVALAAFLRLTMATQHGVWTDEVYSVQIARNTAADIPHRLRFHDMHPPLYFFVLHFWTRLAGEAEWALRFPSILASLGVVAGTYLLGRRLVSPAVGLLAALLAAVSPYQVVPGAEARMYPLLTLFTLTSSYLLWAAIRESRVWRWLAYTVFSALALYTHYFALFIMGFHLCYVVLFRRRYLGLLLLSGAAALGLYLPWLPALSTQLASGPGWPWQPPFSLDRILGQAALFSFGGNLLSLPGYFGQTAVPVEVATMLLFPFLVVALCGMAALQRQREKLAYLLAYLAVPLLAAYLISMQKNIVASRHFSFLFPPFAILMGQGIITIKEQLAVARRQTAAHLVLLYLLLFNLSALLNYWHGAGLPYHGWREAVRFVEVHAGAKDTVLLFPEFAAWPYGYYSRGAQPRIAVLRPKYVPSPELLPTYQAELFTTDRAVRRLDSLGPEAQVWFVIAPPFEAQSLRRLENRLGGKFWRGTSQNFGALRVTAFQRRPP